MTRGFSRTRRFVLRLIHLPPRIAYAIGLGPLIGRLVLLLTTTGRRSGRPRVTPLQYEEVDGCIYLAAALGQNADWFRNILADPSVQMRIRPRQFEGQAEPVTDPCRIADFLQLRLKRHPKMVGAILKAEGLPASPTRLELEAYARRLAMVIVHPINEGY
ncbi:MAG: nitroreductase/quinone reductase family protein [Bacteroidota bacterium]